MATIDGSNRLERPLHDDGRPCAGTAARTDGAAAASRDGLARRRARDGALAARHANCREPRERHADDDRHARRARRQRRPGDTRLAVPRGTRIVRGDDDRDGRSRAADRADGARSARDEPLGHAGAARHGDEQRPRSRGADRRAAARPHLGEGYRTGAVARAGRDGYRCSPIPGAVVSALPVDVHIDID